MNRLTRYEKNNSIIKTVVAILLVLTVLFMVQIALIYPIIENHHNCVGEDCPICETIDMCIQFTSNLQGAFLSAFVVACCICISMTSISIYRFYYVSSTLVSAKVRMDN